MCSATILGILSCRHLTDFEIKRLEGAARGFFSVSVSFSFLDAFRVERLKSLTDLGLGAGGGRGYILVHTCT